MIGPIDNKPIRLDRTSAPGAAGEDDRKAQGRPRQTDRVEISAEARQRAAESQTVSGLSPERVAEIKDRLADGSYGSTEVLETIAHRMIEQGDV